MNSGLERIDLAAGTREWVVHEDVFTDLGFTRLHLSGLDLHADGRVYISAASPNYETFSIYRLELPGDAQDPALVEVVSGLESVTGEFEIVGDELWFLDTTIGGSGVRGFDLSVEPAEALAVGVLATGLPPLSLIGAALD